jgi:hypothetical protein
MRAMPIAVSILILSGAATAVIAATTQITDKFSGSSLNSRWTEYWYGGMWLSPSGGVLKVVGVPSIIGECAIVIEDYELKTDAVANYSWKASVAVKQVMSSASVDSESVASTYVGLQYDDFSEEGFLDMNNGYQLYADIDEDGVSVGWVADQAGEVVDSDGIFVSSSKKLKGSVVATYTGKTDRLVVQVGKFKRTFTGFYANNSFDTDPKMYIGGYCWGNISGTILTLDNFSLKGNGVIQVP